ncbi:hypothetical protein AN639_06830 [Candidatus Epulonipiscium fishelsonii]|uniref:Uncharacterized protein n=1 Tax=Candidatus Epulonipiscium fishelsonii TaxID=77094 RepID=A0ACC8X995_9FIRM|nr:hypothetical protein AN396_10210 [Epulopiscium sp. SCG-B11WGA-EpuloA1]ONI39019.1 hypothetical protein AN639_06830 [Epulopiscium sp. SCG-B05WGA-EpuloA1]
MKLTLRQIEIVKLILETSIQHPCNMQFISNKLNISSRTVLREFSIIEDWFESNNLILIKKSGIGVYWEKNDISSQAVEVLLKDALSNKSFTSEERKYYIVGELLNSKEAIKSNYFITKLGISTKVFKVDFQKVTQWIENHGLSISNKPSVGLSIAQNEVNIRKAIISLTYEIYGDTLVTSLVKEQSVPISSLNKNIFNFLNIEQIKIIKQIISNTNEDANFNDRSYIATIMYLLVALNRIKKKKYIYATYENMDHDYIKPYFEITKKITIQLEKQFNCIFTHYENIYLTKYLLALDIALVEGSESINFLFNKINQDVKELVDKTGYILNMNFKNNKTLIESLSSHFKLAIPRMKMDISVQNFHVAFLKKNYEDIFNATKQSLSEILLKYDIEKIPDEEIGFVTTYFCVAKDKFLEQQKVKIVITCPSGLGTANMIKNSILKYFSNFEIVQILSIINLDINKLKELDVKFIISTVNLDENFPYLKVNPILSSEDKVNLKSLVEKYGAFEEYNVKSQKIQNQTGVNLPTLNQIIQVSELGMEISNLINNIFFYKSHNVTSKLEIIQKISILIGKTEADILSIQKGLQERELISSTYIREFNVYLFHCKTSGVTHSMFGFFKLINPFKNKSGYWVCGGILLLIPENSTEFHVDIFTTISKSLTDEIIMEKLIAVESKTDIVRIIEHSLSQIFVEKLKICL